MDNLLIFVHIFKCGGTFFTGGIRYSYESHEMCSHDIPKEHPSSYFQKNSEEKKDVKFYHGHMSFGSHKEIERPSVYLTIVRDPVDRLLSTYYNLREEKCKHHPLHRIFHTYSLEECISTSCWNKLSPEESVILSNYMDNYQVRILSGTYKTPYNWDTRSDINKEINPSNLKINKHDYFAAVNNLENYFSFVGLCHETDYYWPLLNKKFGFEVPPEVWNSSDSRFSNKTESRPKKEDLPRSLCKKLYAFNRYDYRLYKYVKKNMDRINLERIKVLS
jgi:hypothetical protein